MVSLQNFLQLEDFNGVPLAAGKIYVYHQGRTELAEIYSDINGETPIVNPAILDDLGMQEIYVSNVYNYTVVVTDPYNNELFTRDIYPNGVDGDGNNRLYEGIDPIVVNNDKMAISAKKATLSVQDPLYFVEDSQSAVCIGLQESAYSGLPYVENSAIGYGMAGMQPYISSISGLGFYALSADSASIATSASLANSASLAGSATIADSATISYSAENAGLVTDGWETGSDGRITAYNGTAFSAGKVYSGISPVYVDNENDQIGVSSKDFLANSPLYFTEYSDRVELSISGLPDTPGLMYESGFNYESGKITGYNGSGISAGKVYTGISPVTVDNDNDTISVASAILGVQSPLYFVEDSESATILGVDTSSWTIDIPQSADWQNATDIISSNSGNWDEAYSTVNNNSGDWQSAADELAVLNTAKWEGAADTLSSHSGSWESKLDSAIYAEDSGTFLTALPSDLVYTADIQDMATTGDINDLVTSIAETYQTKTDMTGYLTTGDSSNFYTTANESGFITGVDLTDYATKDFVNDNVASSISGKLDIATYSSESANFLTTADSSEFYPMTGNPSGFLTAETDWTNTITAASAYAYSEATAQIPTDYATTAQLADKLDTAVYATDSAKFITSLPGSANWNNAYFEILAHSATWNDVSAKLDITAYSTASGNFLTAVPADYATTAWVTSQGYLTAETDWTNTITAASAYAYSEATAQIPTDYATTAQLADKLDSAIYAADSGTFLTAHQPISANEWNSVYDTVSDNSAGWTGGGGATGNYISAQGFDQKIRGAGSNTAKYISFYEESLGSTANPAIFLNGQFGSAYYKENELKLGRNNHTIAFNIGGSGPKISAGATGAINSYMYIYNDSDSATISQTGFNLKNSTANEDVTVASIQNWNSTTATVATNSGAWGGQGIELSAGFGIDIQLVDNKLVISLATATGDI